MFHPRTDQAPVDVSDRDYYRMQMKPCHTRIIYCRSSTEPGDEKMGDPISIPSPKNRHRIVVLFAAVEHQTLDRIIRGQIFMENMRITLFKDNGTELITFPHDNEKAAKPYHDERIIRDYLAAGSRKAVVTESGADPKRLVYISGIKGYPLGLAVSVDERTLLHGWYHDAIGISGFGIALTVLINILWCRAKRDGRSLTGE